MKHRSIPAALAAFLPALILAGQATAQEDRAPAPNTLTAAEKEAGWRLLFDGTTTSGWRGYMQEDMPAGWQAVNGALTRVARATDIITTETFRDFELVFEFNVETGGNSGVFYRAAEGPQRIYHGAPEYQVLDDAVHPDGRSPLTSTGSNYALNAVPRGIVKPAGEWNTGRILVQGNHVEHWLNGEKVVVYELASPEWTEAVANSKFVEWPEYGKAAEGHIGIQDHGSRVAFRNIKIRVIE